MYESPRSEIRRVVLEGVIADSYHPTIETGVIQYDEYENGGTPDCDIFIF